MIKFSVCNPTNSSSGHCEFQILEWNCLDNHVVIDCKGNSFHPGICLNHKIDHNISTYTIVAFQNCSIGEWSNVFDNFPKIYKLLFSKNSTLPSDDFPEARRSHIFGMHDSKFRTSSKSLTIDASNLDAFIFIGTQSNNIDNILLKNATELAYFILENTTVTDLPANMFENSTNLHHVYAPFNKIKSIDSIKWPNPISRVNFDSNEIAQLTRRTFENLKNVQYLYFANNQIETIEDGTFENIKVDILELDLSNNKISSINRHTFGGCKLVILNLAENPIREIPADAFAHMSQLMLLNMSSVELETVDFNAFANISNLVALELSNNNISRLVKMAPNAINGTKMEMSTLHQKNLNKLGRATDEIEFHWAEQFKSSTFLIRSYTFFFRLSLLETLQNEFGGMHGVKLMLLTGNQLAAIENNTFAEFKYLYALHLSKNPITTLYPESFAGGLHNLAELFLDHCKLTTIDLSVFTHLPKLKTLDLSYNRLITITGASLPPLKELVLNNNQLVSFPMIESELPNLSTLDVRNNHNLNCSSMETFFRIQLECGICVEPC